MAIIMSSNDWDKESRWHIATSDYKIICNNEWKRIWFLFSVEWWLNKWIQKEIFYKLNN